MSLTPSFAGSQTIINVKEGLAASIDGYKFVALYKRLIENDLGTVQARKVCELVFREVMAVHALHMQRIDNDEIFKKGKLK